MFRFNRGRIHKTITFNNSKIWFCVENLLETNIISSNLRKKTPDETPILANLFKCFPFFLKGDRGWSNPGKHRSPSQLGDFLLHPPQRCVSKNQNIRPPPTTPRLASCAHKDLESLPFAQRKLLQSGDCKKDHTVKTAEMLWSVVIGTCRIEDKLKFGLHLLVPSLTPTNWMNTLAYSHDLSRGFFSIAITNLN